MVDRYDQIIEQQEKNNKEYRIFIDFQAPSLYSLSGKTTVMEKINKLDIDSKVAKIKIIARNGYNQWNDEILTNMITRYTNVYDIEVYDDNDSVDTIHESIKQWVQY